MGVSGKTGDAEPSPVEGVPPLFTLPPVLPPPSPGVLPSLGLPSSSSWPEAGPATSPTPVPMRPLVKTNGYVVPRLAVGVSAPASE